MSLRFDTVANLVKKMPTPDAGASMEELMSDEIGYLNHLQSMRADWKNNPSNPELINTRDSMKISGLLSGIECNGERYIPQTLTEINEFLLENYGYDAEEESSTPAWAYGSALFLALKKKRKELLEQITWKQQFQEFIDGLPSLSDVFTNTIDFIKDAITNLPETMKTIGTGIALFLKEGIPALDDILSAIREKLKATLSVMTVNIAIGASNMASMVWELCSGFYDAYESYHEYKDCDENNINESNSHLLGIITGIGRGMTALTIIPACILLAAGVISLSTGVALPTMGMVFIAGYKHAKHVHDYNIAKEEAEKSAADVKSIESTIKQSIKNSPTNQYKDKYKHQYELGVAKKEHKSQKRHLLEKSSEKFSSTIELIGLGIIFVAATISLGFYLAALASPAAPIVAAVTLGATAIGIGSGAISKVFEAVNEKFNYKPFKFLQNLFSPKKSAEEVPLEELTKSKPLQSSSTRVIADATQSPCLAPRNELVEIKEENENEHPPELLRASQLNLSNLFADKAPKSYFPPKLKSSMQNQNHLPSQVRVRAIG